MDFFLGRVDGPGDSMPGFELLSAEALAALEELPTDDERQTARAAFESSFALDEPTLFERDPLPALSGDSLSTLPPAPERPGPARVYVGPPLPPPAPGDASPDWRRVPGIELEDVPVPEPEPEPEPRPATPIAPAPPRSKVDTVLEKLDVLLESRAPTVREVLDRHEQQAVAVKRAELETAHRLSERARWGEWIRGSLTWGLQGLVLVAAYLWGTPHTQDTLRVLLEWLSRGDL